ncbi:MAG: methylmalonyl Co-A mutase-associated GTPase MeaB [Bdellovibrionota bacterium]
MSDNLGNKKGAKSAYIRSDEVEAYLESTAKGDFRALAKLLTWVERSGPAKALAHKQLVAPTAFTFRAGITGPPGAGKSTLIGEIIQQLRKQGLKVGVLAVDPSSPFSKGAILGDRIRYSEHFNDDGVFIRSVGTRGSLGGLSAASYLMLRAFDCAQFDIVLIETVGVGQTELEIINVADFVSVVLVPESGDSIQAMKAGLTEIADLFVVNKSDRPGAEGLKNELRATLELGENRKPVQIVSTIATEKNGIDEFCQAILKAKKDFDKKSRTTPERLRAEAKALFRWLIEDQIETEIETVKDLPSFVQKITSFSDKISK